MSSEIEDDNSSSGEEVQVVGGGNRQECPRNRQPYSRDEYEKVLRLTLQELPEKPSGKIFLNFLEKNMEGRLYSGLQTLMSTKLQKYILTGKLNKLLTGLTPPQRFFIKEYMKDYPEFKLTKSVEAPAREEDDQSQEKKGLLKKPLKRLDFFRKLPIFKENHHGDKKHSVKKADRKRFSWNAGSRNEEPCEEIKSAPTSAAKEDMSDGGQGISETHDVAFMPLVASSPKEELPKTSLNMTREELRDLFKTMVADFMRNEFGHGSGFQLPEKPLLTKNVKPSNHDPVTVIAEESNLALNIEPSNHVPEAVHPSVANEASTHMFLETNDGFETELVQVAEGAEKTLREESSGHGSVSVMVQSSGFSSDDTLNTPTARMSTISLCEVFINHSTDKKGALFNASPSKRGFTLSVKENDWSRFGNCGSPPQDMTAKDIFLSKVARNDVVTQAADAPADMAQLQIDMGKSPKNITAKLGSVTLPSGKKIKALVIVHDEGEKETSVD